MNHPFINEVQIQIKRPESEAASMPVVCVWIERGGHYYLLTDEGSIIIDNGFIVIHLSEPQSGIVVLL